MTTDTEPKTDAEIANLCHRLANLLEDDEGRGMATWEMARCRVGRELYDALGNALGVSPRALDGET